MKPDHNRKALFFILFTVFLDSMGAGISIPVMPTLIEQLSGATLSDSARIAGEVMACFAALQLFAAPTLGSLSDAFGRRPVLLLSLTAFGIDCILVGLANSLMWLFAARVVSGLFCASGTVAAAFISDISDKESRAKKFGLLTAAWGLGIFIGPAVG